MALLRELPITSGSVRISGRVAYVSQQPWVFSGTLKENILFGKEFDKERYEKVIHVCALETVGTVKYLILCRLVLALFNTYVLVCVSENAKQQNID